MDSVDLRGIRIYPASEPEELIDFAVARKGILVAVNAEKMAKATPELKSLINDNIGYCDGSGVVIRRPSGRSHECAQDRRL